MFKLVALLFLVTNGVPADQPSGSIKKNELFKSEQDCKDYFDTAKKDLEEALAANNLTPKFKCVQVEDNTI
jgi:hypothetical protein